MPAASANLDRLDVPLAPRLDAMQHATTMEEKNRIWMDFFERPKHRDYRNRLNEGQKALNAMRTLNGRVPGEVAGQSPVPDFVLPKGGYWAKDGKGNPVPVGPDGAAIQSYRPASQVPITGPARSKTVSPGKPASEGEHFEAAVHRALGNAHLKVSVAYDEGHQGHIAKFVTKKQVADARFRRSVGQTDNYGRRAHPGSEVIDS